MDQDTFMFSVHERLPLLVSQGAWFVISIVHVHLIRFCFCSLKDFIQALVAVKKEEILWIENEERKETFQPAFSNLHGITVT